MPWYAILFIYINLIVVSADVKELIETNVKNFDWCTVN